MPFVLARHFNILTPFLSLRVVANYILWRFTYKFVSNLDKRFLAKQQEYYSALYGTQTIPPRWKTCTLYTNKILGMAVGSLFVKSHFNERSKETVRMVLVYFLCTKQTQKLYIHSICLMNKK